MVLCVNALCMNNYMYVFSSKFAFLKIVSFLHNWSHKINEDSLYGKLNCLVKLANVLTRCCSHSQGKSEAKCKVLVHQATWACECRSYAYKNTSILAFHFTFALRLTRASSQYVGTFYRTFKLSAENLRLFHADSN